MIEMWPEGQCQQNVESRDLPTPPPVSLEWERQQREFAEKCEAAQRDREAWERDSQLRMSALDGAVRVTSAAGDYQLTLRAYRDILAALRE